MILLTGATGHLGNVLLRQLLAQGERVRVLILSGDDGLSIAGLDVERVAGNVLDPALLDRAMEGVQVVYHLAAVISITPGAEELMRRVNVEGVHNIAVAAHKAGVKRMVHVSSIHAFQRMPHGLTVDETSPLALNNPAGAYDCSKAQGAKVVLQAVEAGLDAVIVYPTGIIGPFDYKRSEMGQTVLDFSRKKLHLLIDGAYDFVDVRDVAQGLILACAKGKRGEGYILSGARVGLTQLRDMVQEIVGVHSPALVLPFGFARWAAGAAEHFYRLSRTTPRFTRYALQTIKDNCDFSCARAESELGYSPRPLQVTLADTLDWWRKTASVSAH